MKVLLINDRPHQFSLLKSVSDNLYKSGIYADIFVPNTGKFYSPLGEKFSLLLRGYALMCKNKILSILLTKLFHKYYVYHFSKKYEAIDFQGLFAPAYQSIIPKLKTKYKKKILVTLWGSDFYRQAGGTYKQKEPCYKYCDLIHISTHDMKDDFLKVYPQYEKKIRVIHFGIEKLDKLKNILEMKKKNSFLPEIIQDKDIVITCGYNGIPAQQHRILIEVLSSLSLNRRNRLFVIIPMTYGTPPEYKKEIEELLMKSGLKYYILDHYVGDEQLLDMRVRTNIAINIQTTDAFAGSVQEHIMARNLLIVGDWLPYHKIFKENNIYAVFSDLNHLYENILWGIDHYEEVKEKLYMNTNAIYEFSSWKNVTPTWSRIYHELLIS